MRNARLFGILFGILGLIMSWFYLSTLNEIGATFKFLIIGPFLVGAGLGMILMPGYTLTESEWAIKEQRLKLIFANTAMLNKVIWIVLGAIAVGMVEMGMFNSFFGN